MCQEAGADVLGLVSPSALCLPLSAGAVSVPRLQSPVANWGGVCSAGLRHASLRPHLSHLPVQPLLQDGPRAVEALLP